MTEDEKTPHLTSDDIDIFIDTFDDSNWRELDLQYGQTRLYISKDANSQGIQNKRYGVEPKSSEDTQKIAKQPITSPQTKDEEIPASWVAVTAPNLGTFYRSPKPGDPPFVEEGQSVEEDTEVCLIEVMKLFTQVNAGTQGVVKKICIKDAEMVEYGQPLLYIEPTD